MKSSCLFIVIFFCTTTQVIAQTNDYKIVFDITSKDTNVHKAVIKWCSEIIKADPAAKLEWCIMANHWK